MQQRPALLEIYGIGDSLFNISLTQALPDGGKSNLIKTVLPVHINAYALKNISEKINQIPLAPTELQRLQSLGQALYDIIFSSKQDIHLQEIKLRLEQNTAPLLIVSNQADIFWELLNMPASGEFFALKNGLIRGVFATTMETSIPEKKEAHQCLFVQSRQQKNAALIKTLRQVIEGAKDETSFCPISIKTTSPGELKSGKKNGGDILHFTGALATDIDHEFILTVNSRTKYNPSELAACASGAALVILQISTNDDFNTVDRRKARQIFAEKVLSDGIQALLIVYEHDPEALLAGWQQFYKSLASGETIAEAINLLRRHLYDQAALAQAWLEIFLFGNPVFDLQFREASSLPSHTGVFDVIEKTDSYPTAEVAEIGLLNSTDCHPAAWQILIQSALNAKSYHNAGISSINLFLAMLSDKNSALNKALKRFGFLEHFQEFQTEDRLDASILPKKVACSSSVGKAMALAQKYVSGNNGNRVNDGHLLTALIRQGAGNTGKWLLQQGIIPELLISKLFDDNGHLNHAVFEKNALKIIQCALQFGQEKNHTILGRMHIIYAMLHQGESLLARRINALHHNAAALAKLYAMKIEAGPPVERKMQASYREMSTRLVLVFCNAELIMEKYQRPQLGEDLLLDALLADGAGSAGKFLIKEGVPWPKL